MQWNFWDEVKAHTNPLRKINIKNLRPGPIRHETLPEELIARIMKFQAILAEVDPERVETVVDDFRRDLHPEREVVTWEGITEKYQRQVKGDWPIDKKERLYKRLVLESLEESPIVVRPVEY